MRKFRHLRGIVTWPQHTDAAWIATAKANAFGEQIIFLPRKGALSPDHNKHTPLGSQTTRQNAFQILWGDLEGNFKEAQFEFDKNLQRGMEML